MIASLLDSRASFELAAFFVTWVAVVLLVLVVGNLHARLQRLEQAAAVRQGTKPYSHLLGRQIQDLLGDVTLARQPHVLVFLSSDCKACMRVMNELKSPSWTTPSVIIWTDRPPSPPPGLPPNAFILDDGQRISAALGIRVTPFVLVANEDGRIVKAAPTTTLSSLADGAVDVRQAVHTMTS